MNGAFMLNHARSAQHSLSTDAAFTSADVENSAKRDAIAFYR
jgi:hypothetical protein